MAEKSSIPRTGVDSSALTSMGYDPATQTLAIEYASGVVYHFLNVPQERYTELLGAESIGRASQALRSDFECERVS